MFVMIMNSGLSTTWNDTNPIPRQWITRPPKKLSSCSFGLSVKCGLWFHWTIQMLSNLNQTRQSKHTNLLKYTRKQIYIYIHTYTEPLQVNWEALGGEKSAIKAQIWNPKFVVCRRPSKFPESLFLSAEFHVLASCSVILYSILCLLQTKDEVGISIIIKIFCFMQCDVLALLLSGIAIIWCLMVWGLTRDKVGRVNLHNVVVIVVSAVIIVGDSV